MIKREDGAIRIHDAGTRREEHIWGAFNKHPGFGVFGSGALTDDSKHPLVPRVERDFQELLVGREQACGIDTDI